MGALTRCVQPGDVSAFLVQHTIVQYHHHTTLGQILGRQNSGTVILDRDWIKQQLPHIELPLPIPMIMWPG